MTATEFVVVQVQIVGNPVSGYQHSYSTDGRRHTTTAAAIRHGINRLGHDDFLLAHLDGDQLEMTSWQYEDRPDEVEERLDMAYQLGWAARR